ncbi:hypothetical protein LFYK43_04730 [Ligilactobacillus salitolerans]|uniref:Uncharacterized protein n=1 Tax=Ligilactobacillus salitolerans TaxID=1808352 RepID=A0A401IR93_9LACO|nr:hypothetical protein [Ligilactobacillus salitolerans]GBG94014.1 hypothetical protein LFYK43_04730 [Ligilactobacillus salitolerans]
MKKKALIFSGVIVFIGFICFFFFLKKDNDKKIEIQKKENSYVTKINYGQTYTYDATKDGSYDPSYIKFIDSSHYVAVPVLDIKEDPEEDDGPAIYFIQGKYRKDEKSRFQLGKSIRNTTLIFDSYADFEKGDFKKNELSESQARKFMLPFEENFVQKKGKYYFYRWKTMQGDYPYHTRKGFVHLRKAKKDIPTTEKEFIRKYHKKQ